MQKIWGSPSSSSRGWHVLCLKKFGDTNEALQNCLFGSHRRKGQLPVLSLRDFGARPCIGSSVAGSYGGCNDVSSSRLHVRWTFIARGFQRPTEGHLSGLSCNSSKRLFVFCPLLQPIWTLPNELP